MMCCRCCGVLCATRPWKVCDVSWKDAGGYARWATVEGEFGSLEVMCCVLPRILEGGICLLEMLEVPEAMCCVLLCILEVMEAMRCMLLCMLEVLEVPEMMCCVLLFTLEVLGVCAVCCSVCWRLWG